MIQPYYELKNKSSSIDLLTNLIPTLDFSLIYGNQYASILNPEILVNDVGLYSAVKHFGSEARIAIYRTEPRASYSWHVDGIRNCAVNLLITGDNSMTVFGKQYGQFFKELTILPYAANTFYLLNTGIMHSVYNFSDNYRYLLGIGFRKEYTYDEIKNFLIENDV